MAMLMSYADNRWRATIIWALVVLAFREDLALTVLLLGGLSVLDRREWRWAVSLGGISVVWLGLSTQVLLPLILPSDYGSVVLTTNLSGGIPLLERLTEESHLGALLSVLVSFGLLPLRSRLTLVGAVGIAAIVLNRHPITGNLIHLTTPWIVAAYAGTVTFVVSNNGNRRAAILCVCAIGMHCQALLPPTVHIAPLVRDATDTAPVEAWSPLHPENFAQSAADIRRWDAVKRVPKGASVAAVGHFLPMLVPRAKVYEYGHGYVPFTVAEWAILEANVVNTSAGGHVSLTQNELTQHLDLLHSAGWKTMSTFGDIQVLKRTKTAPTGLADRLRNLIGARTAPSPESTTGTNAIPPKGLPSR